MTQSAEYVCVTHDWGGRIRATVDGQHAGELEFASDGFVESVTVREAFRRKGIATGMLHAMPITPSFSTEGNSPDGNAWIAAVQRTQIDRSENKK